MNTRYLTLRALFQHLVLAGAVPLAGCGGTVVMTGGDAAPQDRNDPTDTVVTDVTTPPPDVPRTDSGTVDTSPVDVTTDAMIVTDRVVPADTSSCAPVVGPDVTCSYPVTYPCGDPPRDATGSLICADICVRDAGFPSGCYAAGADGGSAIVVQCTYCAVGRRVDGFAPVMGSNGGAVGRFYAAVAQLEAVSVVAFERLAAELTAGSQHEPTVYVLDEPTTGLHLSDVRRLLGVMEQLVARGDTLVVIEHHPDVIACADWVVELGPEAGERGGEVVFEGTPEELAAADTATGRFLAKVDRRKSRSGPKPAPKRAKPSKSRAVDV